MQTDEEGGYTLPPIPKTTRRLTVVAEGYEPKMVVLPDSDEEHQIRNFVLSKGSIVKIQIVDDQGVAIPSVSVVIREWLDRKTYIHQEHGGVSHNVIPRLSDEEGVYAWTWAPKGNVTYHFHKTGYQGVSHTLLAGEEHQIILRKEATQAERKATETRQKLFANISSGRNALRPSIADSRSSKATSEIPQEWIDKQGEDVLLYAKYIESLRLKHVTAYQVLHPHFKTRGRTSNSIPPKHLWGNIALTLKVVDQISSKLDAEVSEFVSSYRSPKYNRAVRGSSRSWHLNNNAVTVKFKGVPSDVVAKAARKLRREGFFKGGVGQYGTHTHIDTRGANVDWSSQASEKRGDEEVVRGASARPNGEPTDGNPVRIERIGFSITPKTGMKTVLAGESEPHNYRFPWFRGKQGLVEFAIVSNEFSKMSLKEGFASYVEDKKRGGKFYTGKSEQFTTKNGIEVIRAEFQVEGGIYIVRYFLKCSKGELCYVHTVPIAKENKELETMILETLTVL